MTLSGIFGEAFAALRFNRQRSLLTMASLAWGVACFVILYSYGEGFGTALQTSFQAVGQDLVLMFGGQTSTQAGGERAGHKIRLEMDDVQTIRDTVPLVGAISGEIMVRGATVVRGLPRGKGVLPRPAPQRPPPPRRLQRMPPLPPRRRPPSCRQPSR